MIGRLTEPFRLAVVGALALAVGCGAGYLAGRADGAAVAETRAIKSTIKQLKQRSEINEAVRDTDTADLCIELGGLPEQCNAE